MSGEYFSLLTMSLVAGVMLLRVRFPNASDRAETVVVAAATVVFFSLCQAFLTG